MVMSHPVDGTLYITLKSHLEHIAAHERSKPLNERRLIPSMDELARMVGIHPVTLSNIANSRIKQLNLVLGGRILTALHHYGFTTTIGDIIAYRSPDATLPVLPKHDSA